jgi:hypothetical protein
MRPHPYLRAYLAGIATPTVFLLLIVTADAVLHAFFHPSLPPDVAGLMPRLERVLPFPMAVVPNLWGLWNIAYAAIHGRRPRWPIGVHGALLVLVLVPAGVVLARAMDVADVTLSAALPVVPIAMAIYYLAWKFIVGFLNTELGVS